MADVDQVVSQYYNDLGGPASFSGFQKLKLALKADGYQFSDLDVRNALGKIDEWNRFRSRYSTIPPHVPLRFSHVSHSGLWLFVDSKRRCVHVIKKNYSIL